MRSTNHCDVPLGWAHTRNPNVVVVEHPSHNHQHWELDGMWWDEMEQVDEDRVARALRSA